MFLALSRDASTGEAGALKRLRSLHQAIVDREEQGETLSRLLPTGLAEKVRLEGGHIGETEELDVTVIMSDVRGYSGIAETTDPSALAHLLNEHRAAMNGAILDEGGTVMQFVGDAVMACFGAPVPQDDHADRAFAAAVAMIEAQVALDADVGRARPAAVRARHRPLDRSGRRRAARLRRTARVHARRRHREPRATTPGSRAPGRLSRVQRSDARSRSRRRPTASRSASRR